MRTLWIPNALTVLRVLLLPVFLGLLTRVPPEAGAGSAYRLVVVGIFLLLALTDWLDGYLARRLEATTRLGSIADAVADRLALLLPLLYLVLRPHPAFPAVPLWIPLWLIALDLAAGTTWLIARSKAPDTPSAAHVRVGRVAVWILFMLVLWILVGLPVAGVLVLGLSGLTLATASAILHIRRWARAAAA